MNKISTKSIDKFCDKIIDYAGLFPPASLKLDVSFDNFINYRNSEFNYIIANFICPVKLLSQLSDLIKNKYPQEKDIPISIIGRGGYNSEDFSNNLKEDLYLCQEFIKNSGNSCESNFFEVKLPDDLITSHDPDKISEFLHSVSESVKNSVSQTVFIFFEGHIGTDWKKNIGSLIKGLNIHNTSENNAGFKLRTGGVEAYSFPSTETITYSIRDCLDKAVPMKFTAGLHHPFRHFNESVNTKMHGFVNVFGAGAIAMRHNISDSEINEILNDENPNNFIFTDEYFSWNDWKINNDEILLARKNIVTSYGSCSFDEPVSDLKDLNLL